MIRTNSTTEHGPGKDLTIRYWEISSKAYFRAILCYFVPTFGLKQDNFFNAVIIFKISLFPIIRQNMRKFLWANPRKMRIKHLFGLFWTISGQKSAIMGTNRIPNEIRFNFVFKIALFPIITQKIRTFPWPNLEKMAKNAIFGLKKTIFLSQQSAIMAQFFLTRS